MMNPRSLRYPGVRPFETHERHLFFGRSRDIEELYDLILLERLTVLFAKSGYGKSSLLKAGIIPKFTDPDAPDSRQYRPIELRFGTYVPGKSAAPLEVVAKALEAIPVVVEAGFLAGLTAGTRLWHHFKMGQGATSPVSTPPPAPPPNRRGDVMPSTSGTARFLLIFDQVEEFFSYPEAEQAQFRAEMAELLYEEIPQDVRLAARAGTREQRAFLATPFDAKVVFSLRADRLSLLDGMKDRLPAILHKRYELKALDEQQAREAIVMPAGLSEESGLGLFGAPFQYSEDALQKMLRELSGKDAASRGGIEAFQLQIVCASIEKRVNDGGLNTVTAADLPDFGTVYEDYYQSRISELPPEEQLPARRVLEDGLLLVDAQSGDARRLSRDSVELSQSLGVAPELLKNLERTYLLRRELNTLGGYNYEISHDTLIAPMLKSRKAREATLAEQRQAQERIEALRRAKEAEEKVREEVARRAEAERLQEAAEKAKRRANVFALGAAVLALLAGGAFFMAQKQSNIAKQENAKAQLAHRMAIEQMLKADSSAAFARLQEMRADTQNNIAQSKANEARLALADMETANDRLIKQTLDEARAEVLALRYSGASDKLHGIAALGRMKADIAGALFEIAYFYNEIGEQPKAQKELSAAAALLGKNVSVLQSGDRKAFRAALKNLRPNDFDFLETRYYPVMTAVKGGAFDIPTARRVTLSDYQMAQSPTTVWQYNLLLSAQGKSILDEKTIKRPAAGWRGNSPMVFVSWYDAVQYANWLSAQRGLAPAYTIDQAQKDTNNFSDTDALKWAVTKRKRANGFRLPTKTEWEYAALRGDFARENTWNWCWDWSAEEPPTGPANNPEGPTFGRYRVACGKSPGGRSPDSRTEQWGFRLARGEQ